MPATASSTPPAAPRRGSSSRCEGRTRCAPAAPSRTLDVGGAPLEIPLDVRDTHQNLSPLALGFLDYVQEKPERARRLEDPEADLPAWVLRYTYPMQAWPSFVGAAKLAEVERA